ncbi:MAG: PIN domain-containing protein [Anaerolineae bacterium]|nr:PIN domain-containing protein [Anaerolineae bacterium]
MMAIADTSFVVAVANLTDQHHPVCLAAYLQQKLIYIPQSTFAEVGYMLTRQIGNAGLSRFLLNLPATKYRLAALEPEDIDRTAELLSQYADSRIDFVDATIAAVAERLNITQILTLHQRDFRIFRPRHCEYFDVLPETL